MDSSFEKFQYISNITFPILLFTFGVIGDLFGLMIFCSNNKLKTTGPVLVYRALFVFDFLTIIQVTINFLSFGLGIKILTSLPAYCKLFNFINYSFSAISPMLLVYISLDRFISIKYLSRRKYLKNNKIQLIFIFALIVFNFIFYIPTIIGTGIVQYNENETIQCNYINTDYQLIISFMDLFNRAIFPFILMISLSLALIITIFNSRQRVSQGSISERKTFKKDVKFSISSITLNFVFLLSSLPISLILFFPDYVNVNYYFAYQIFYWLFYLCYAANFYIFFFTNSIFRKLAFNFLKCNFQLQSSSHARTN